MRDDPPLSTHDAFLRHLQRIGLRSVLHDIKNHLGVAYGTLTLHSDAFDASVFEPGLDSLGRIDRSIVLLQRLVHDDFEEVAPFDLRAVTGEIATKLEKLGGQSVGLENLDVGDFPVLGPRAAVLDALAMLLGNPECSIDLESISTVDVTEDDETLTAGRFVLLRLVERAARVNLEPSLIPDQLTIRVRGGDLRRAGDGWQLWLPCADDSCPPGGTGDA